VSRNVRLGLVLGCFVVCVLLQSAALIFAHSFALSAVFALPAALAAWMFKWRGAALGVGACMLVFIIVNTAFTRTILWPFPLTLSFFVGSLGIGIVTFALSAACHGLDLAYEARLQGEKAQAQMALASERQYQLEQLKEQLILNVSHELRTPLTVLSGYLELLRNHQGQLDELAQKGMLDAAYVSCDELQQMVDKMLEVAQVEHQVQEPSLEPVALAELIRRVLTEVYPRHGQEHLVSTLDIPEQWTVRADRQYLRQVVRNLLINAFTYTPPQTLISISARWEQEETTISTTRSLVVCIQDAGPGISPEHIPLLFQKFVRLKRDLSGSIRGTGLGLYICRQLVERMGGRIWVESSGIAGEGCRFCFTLPAFPGPSSSLI
jgi:signal transduction histidine kinase